MDDAEKYQALKAIYSTLDKPTPPEVLYIEPLVGPAWLYVDGAWFEAGLEDHALFLVRWHREAEARWGAFGTRMNVAVPALTRVECEAILGHVRATA